MLERELLAVLVDDGVGFVLGGVGIREEDGGLAAFALEARDGGQLRCRGRRLLRLQRLERRLERAADVGESYAVLRTLRTGEARLDRREIERQDLRVVRLRRAVRAEETLLLRVGFDESDARLGAAREAQVRDRGIIQREEPARRAVLRRHVRDRGAVGERELGEAGAGELDELADDAVLPKHLGHAQDEVGRGRAFGESADEAHADDLRDEHRNGLTEHRRFRFDAADAPAEDAEAVDHRRVRVRADERVGEP